MSEMIPFGKYKGQPIEVLEHDPQYADWLAQQDWVKDRYPQIVNIIINKFGENEETPDHNAMQAKFMDRRYCALMAELLGVFRPKTAAEADRQVLNYLRSEYREMLSQGHFGKVGGECKVELHCLIDKSLSEAIRNQAFEKNAIDVSFDCEETEWSFSVSGHWKRPSSYVQITKSYSIHAELKPVVGDDYPAVLRQMRNNRSNVLVYGSYTGRGVDEATFRQFFKMQKIAVIKESEIMADADAREKVAVEKIKLAIEEVKQVILERVTAGDSAVSE
jgi:hypothetical protein